MDNIDPLHIVDGSLEKVMGRDDPDYILTKGLVELHLFSQYPDRKPWALEKLCQMWQTPINVRTVAIEGGIEAYLQFGKVEKYILVDRYAYDVEFREPKRISPS